RRAFLARERDAYLRAREFAHICRIKHGDEAIPRAIMFENIRADFHAFNGNWGAQGFWVMIVYRFGRWRYGLRLVLLRKLCSAVYWVLFKIVQILTGIEMPCEVIVGRNF